MGGDLSSIRERLKARAISLGFSICGIASPERLQSHERYLKWLREGHQAAMGYLSSPYHVNSRQDPHLLWPEVRSILVVGVSYPLHRQDVLENPGIGLISGYATGEDYHVCIKSMLEPLLDWLQTELDGKVKGRVFSDSAPILERELAVRAGLGWIGRNSSFISPVAGSNILLAEMFLDHELGPDSPFTKELCGTCTKCVDACPAHCILEDRTIDSGRCISYNTIENKGIIPDESKRCQGNWIFGCDVCQMVCPWNLRNVNNLSADQEPPLLDLDQMLDLLSLDQSELDALFAKSALSRSGWTAIIRNILVVSGNSGQKRGIPMIKKLLKEADHPAILNAADWALNQLSPE